MTVVQYEWTANDNKTRVVVDTLAKAKALKEKFKGNYKVKYTEFPHAVTLAEIGR
jgi:hypothetical protein